MRTPTSTASNRHTALFDAAATRPSTIQQRVDAARQALLDQVAALTAGITAGDPDDHIADAQLAAMRSAGLALAAAADAALNARR